MRMRYLIMNTKTDSQIVREGFRELKQTLNVRENDSSIPLQKVMELIDKIETSFARFAFYLPVGSDPVEIRYDLKCDSCGYQVKDQRGLKADPNETDYTTNKPDFKCTNYKDCEGGFVGDKGGFISKGWWVNGKSGHQIPKEWNL